MSTSPLSGSNPTLQWPNAVLALTASTSLTPPQADQPGESAPPLGDQLEHQRYAAYGQTQPDLRFPDLPKLTLPLPPDTLLSLGESNSARQASTPHVYQYGPASEAPGLTDAAIENEKNANCGPSAAAMVLNDLGIPHGDLHQLRKDGDAILGNQRSDSYAIDADQLRQMVDVNALAAGREIESEQIHLKKKPEQAFAQIEKALQEGNQVILRTANMETGSGVGHYVVVKGISPPPERGLIVLDPQNESGQTHLEPFDEFASALKSRQRSGGINDIILFREKPAPALPDPTIPGNQA